MNTSRETLEKILKDIPKLNIGLIGDGCLDIYWKVNMMLSELSREVPQHNMPVVEERMSLGAAANVLTNLSALGAKNIKYLTCIGTDWRGSLFKNLLNNESVCKDYIIESDDFITSAYCKPIRSGISPVLYESPRLDFTNTKPLPNELEEKMLENIKKISTEVDILIVCDQFKYSCITKNIIEYLCELGKTLPIIVDSRDNVHLYKNVMVKPNEFELGQLLGIELNPDKDMQVIKDAAKRLEQTTNRPALVTIGDKGVVWCCDGKSTHVKAIPIEPPVDFVGAGDSFLAGFSLAYLLNHSIETTLEFANMVSAITIKKIGRTGVATPQEMRELLDRVS